MDGECVRARRPHLVLRINFGLFLDKKLHDWHLPTARSVHKSCFVGLRVGP